MEGGGNVSGDRSSAVTPGDYGSQISRAEVTTFANGVVEKNIALDSV